MGVFQFTNDTNDDNAWLGAERRKDGILEILTHVVFTTNHWVEETTTNEETPKRNDVQEEQNGTSILWWHILVACTLVVGLLVVIAILWINLHSRHKKGGRISIIESGEFRPYSLFSLSARNSQNQIRNIPVVADHWEIPISSLKFGPPLGQGAFGKVVLGRVSRTMLSHRGVTAFLADGGGDSLKDGDKLHATVAIKMLQESSDRKLCEDFLKEIRLMKRIGYHRNVVPMLACCTLRDPMCLLVEHLPRGDLQNFMRTCRTRRARTSNYVNEGEDTIKPLDLVRFALDIAKGMTFLTSNGFVHRDLAARNVLIARDKTCKIGDFGLARYIYDDVVYVNRRGGRLPVKWMAVEAIFDQSFSSASDVWSFGILLYELVTLGGVPYPTVHTRDLLRRLQAGYRMPRPNNCHETTYAIMLECWGAEPGDRPTFTNLVERLTAMLESSSDLVKNIAPGPRELDPDVDSLSQVSTDTDYGLLLVNELNQEIVDQQEASTVIFRMSNGTVSGPQVRFTSTSHHPEMDRLRLVGEDRASIVPNTSQNLEVISEDSGFEPSPKVSESGSEVMEAPFTQSQQVFYGKPEEEQTDCLPGASLPLSSHSLSMSAERQDTDVLDNDVFHVDSAMETKRQPIEKLRDLKVKRNTVCRHDIDQKFYLRSRSSSLVAFGKTVFETEYANTPRMWHSCPNIAFPKEECLNIQREELYNRDILSSIPTPHNHQNQQKPKKERRKAVVTPPTLALDNETYLALDLSHRQLPPPLQITRRTKTRDTPVDFDCSRKSSATSSCASRRESQCGSNLDIMQKQEGKFDGIFHRVLVQVYRSPSSPLTQGKRKEKSLSRQGKAPHVNQLTMKNSSQDMPTTPAVTRGKVVERGKRKFIRPQDISIEIPYSIENQNIGSFTSDKRLLPKDPKNTKTKIGQVSSLSSRISVSPVRYVHFQFPNASSDGGHTRSLSENNILASSSITEEFSGLPKTMKTYTLLNESSPHSLPVGICTWTKPPSSLIPTKQICNAQGHGYIPIRRFSDPSSLPVSFIRHSSQASSPHSTTDSSFSPAATESNISPAHITTNFYSERDSPLGIPNMHQIRWPRLSVEHKKVSWVERYDVEQDIDRESNGTKEKTLHAGEGKTFVKEKHPFALYQV